jgi:hypothetical protein
MTDILTPVRDVVRFHKFQAFRSEGKRLLAASAAEARMHA